LECGGDQTPLWNWYWKYASLQRNARPQNRANTRPAKDHDSDCSYRIKIFDPQAEAFDPRKADLTPIPKLCYSTALQKNTAKKLWNAVAKTLECGGDQTPLWYQLGKSFWSSVAIRHRFGIGSGNRFGVRWRPDTALVSTREIVLEYGGDQTPLWYQH
jgi:hypothetical protein